MTSAFPSLGEKVSRWWTRQHALVAVIACTVALVLAAGSGIAWLHARSARRTAEAEHQEYLRLSGVARQKIADVHAWRATLRCIPIDPRRGR